MRKPPTLIVGLMLSVSRTYLYLGLVQTAYEPLHVAVTRIDSTTANEYLFEQYQWKPIPVLVTIIIVDIGYVDPW